MDFSFKDFSFDVLQFEREGALVLALAAILFLLFEIFPGRSYFYSLQNLRRFIDRHLVKHLLLGTESRTRSWLRVVFIGIIWALLALALANPRWDYEEIEGYKPNINIVILLDVSKSMDTADVKPNRLKRAKQEVVDIIKKVEGINIGIVAFANQSYVVSPVTDDKNSIMYLLPSITTSLVGVQGSNIQAGLMSADMLLKPMKGGVNYIVVMTDGGFENTSGLKDMAKQVKNARVITYGFGTEEGAPIPDDEGKFIKDDKDKTVISKLEKQNLINLSGLDYYIESTYLDDDSGKVARIVMAQENMLKAKARNVHIWHDRFYIPLIIAMLLLLPFFRKGSIFPVVIMMMFLSTPSHAQNFSVPKNGVEEDLEEVDDRSMLDRTKSTFFKNSDQQAKDYFYDKKYKRAENRFSSPYNKGISAFRAGEMQKAEEYFTEAAPVNIEAEYNLGNTQLLQMKVREAIASYENVLKRNPQHEDAKHNLEIARKLLKNQPPQQQQQNKQQTAGSAAQGNDNKGNSQQHNAQQGQQNNAGSGQQNTAGKSQENDGNSGKTKVDIQTRNILSKVNSDPGALMKNRFRFEEAKNGNGKKAKGSDKIKPW